MAPPIPLERIQEQCRQRLADRKRKNQEKRARERRYAPLQAAIDEFWDKQTILQTPTPPYACSLSQPAYKYTQWKHLSTNVQDELRETFNPTDAEWCYVPVRYLGESAASVTLSNKLSEYTRGLSGRVQPFAPGGIDANVTEEVDRSEEIAKSCKILSQSTKESWDQGLLLTAPPGVDLMGLTWEQVHGNAKEDNDEEEEVGEVQQEETIETEEVRGFQAPSSFYDRAFFEDDSLFGSSSSESESDDEEESVDEKEKQKDEDANEPIQDLSFLKLKDESTVTTVAPSDGEEDLDQLLKELSLDSTDRIFEKRKQPTAIQLAEQQAQHLQNTSRKTWASAQLLPIHDFASYIPNPALVYPFTLDTFQQQAIARLERSESVFVAAHTSAGKTVVAEYAIALAQQRSTRCIYTSPIKALSNQKFRDFCGKYGADNVGLVTGDMQVNVEDATVLIMTTEILRSMLYRGADIIRDIEFVIFDEVHYVNDSERGVVWEEVIIMLPSYVNMVFLSATTPNTFEFSDWIGRTKRRPVFVVTTNYRPVPLSHHLWAGNKLHKILEGKGSFLEAGYKAAAQELLPQSMRDVNRNKSGQKPKKQPPAKLKTGSKQMAWQAQGSKNNWVSLVKHLDREILTPAVIFSFSKKKCEEIAHMLQSQDLNTAKERSAVQGFTLQAVARLSENDRKLPQVKVICEMALRGIGVHHGGLLPILKEMVEILCSRNLIKVLMATETFAMGVNMPMKCVVFNSIRKHDGRQFRNLEPGEYTQMAGRAGRRGLDSVGIVILCCFGEEPPPQAILKNMLTGKSSTLRSQFRLTYNMILNLLRVEEMSVESMIKRSFSEFATQRALAANDFPKLLARGRRSLEKLQAEATTPGSRFGASDLDEYFNVSRSILKLNGEVLNYIHDTDRKGFEDLFPPGRVLLVTAAREYSTVRGAAMVLRMSESSVKGKLGSPSKTEPPRLVCLLLLPEGYIQAKNDDKESVTEGTLGYVGKSNRRHYSLQAIDLDHVLLVSEQKEKIDSTKILKEQKRSAPRGMLDSSAFFKSKPMRRNDDDPFAGMKSLKKPSESSTSFQTGGTNLQDLVQLLIEVEAQEESGQTVQSVDLATFATRGSDVMYYRELCSQVQEKTALIRSMKSHTNPNLVKWYTEVDRIETLAEKVDTLQKLLSNESLALFPDFLQRKAVLRKLGYVDANETVCIKGRVACEVNTCEELIATEMVFEGILNDMEPEEIVAVLSALVFQEKKDEALDSELPERLKDCCDKMKTIATNLGILQKQQGLELDPGDYCDACLKFGLVHVVYEWALGVPFKNICELTDVQEGSIVRCITRLDELCREIRNCARVVGNPTLYHKLEDASITIKRDIVFASSLYVNN